MPRAVKKKRIAGPRVRKFRKNGVTLWLYDHFVPHEGNGHNPHYFRTASLAALAVAVLLMQGLYFGATRIVYLQTDFLASVLPGVLVSLANEDRAKNGVGELEEDPALSAAAQRKAEDMAAKGYFSHKTPDGKEPWYWFQLAGYRYQHAGENLAVNFTDSEDVEEAWMESPTHRANLMKAVYTKVGIGVANGMYEGKEATFVVQFFATPPAAPAVSTQKPAVEPNLLEDAATMPAPAPVQIASTPVATDEGAVVLGSEDATPVHSTPTRESLSLWEKFLASLTSPSSLLQSALIGFFSLTLAALMFGILMRLRVPHPGVLVGSTVLTVVFLGALYLNASLIVPVTLPGDETANAISAVSR